MSIDLGTNEEYVRVKLPNKNNNEIFAIADLLLGGSRINVICADDKSRMARIPGKMKRGRGKRRIRNGDLVIIKIWDFQDAKADVIYRYTKTQTFNLKRRNLLPSVLDVF